MIAVTSQVDDSVSRAMRQLQAALAIKQLREDHPDKVVLHGPRSQALTVHPFSRCCTYQAYDDVGYDLYLSRSHEGDDAGFWWGSEERVDVQGRTWERRIHRAVVDDFGGLVEVEVPEC